MNALAIAGRELARTELEPDDAELLELARRIRADEPPEGALASLKEHVAAKFRVASPRYLDRYQ